MEKQRLVAAETKILDRAYGRPVPVIDANITDDPIRFYAELPMPAATTEDWLKSIRREEMARPLITSVAAADAEQQH